MLNKTNAAKAGLGKTGFHPIKSMNGDKTLAAVLKEVKQKVLFLADGVKSLYLKPATIPAYLVHTR